MRALRIIEAPGVTEALRAAVTAAGITILLAGSAHAGSISLTGPTSTAGTYSPSTLATAAAANPGNMVSFGGLTGISLWGLLGGANATTSAPAIFGAITTTTPAADNSKNAILRYHVLGTGTDGTQSVVSLGQIDPMFGAPVNPPFIAYQNTGGSMLSTPQLVVPGGPSGSGISSLLSLQLLSYPALPTGAGGVSTSVTLSGNVNSPGVYTLAQFQKFTPTNQTVSGDTYTGIPLATFVNTNSSSSNSQIVIGQGTDGYEVLYSLEELANPANMLAYAATGTDFPADGIARTILPADNAHGRYISNLFNVVVLNASIGAPITATHDFNGDGISDILWRDTAGNVGMWLMNGSQIGATSVLGNVATNWSIVGQRDFNGNGSADILWRDIAGNVGIWLMNGSQIKASPVLGNVPTNWSVVGTGDFNGDGYADILWRDNLGNVGIWFMNGTTVSQTAMLGIVPTNWAVAGTDMKGDIFWRNTVTGETGLWIVSGTKISQSVDFGVVPLNWKIAGIGDFDGNGSFDILWRDASGNVGIWLMNGTQIMSTAVLGNVPLSWSVAETGNFNGNGQIDILWIDNLGNVAVWFMNGVTVQSVTNYGNAGTAWSVQSLNAD
jgi:hypothetical protein